MARFFFLNFLFGLVLSFAPVSLAQSCAEIASARIEQCQALQKQTELKTGQPSNLEDDAWKLGQQATENARLWESVKIACAKEREACRQVCNSQEADPSGALIACEQSMGAVIQAAFLAQKEYFGLAETARARVQKPTGQRKFNLHSVEKGED